MMNEMDGMDGMDGSCVGVGVGVRVVMVERVFMLGYAMLCYPEPTACR